MLVEASRDSMMQLSRTTQESVGLIVAVNGQVICLEIIESTQSLRCSFEKGRALPLRAGALAKSLLAFMADKTRVETLERQFAGDDPARAANSSSPTGPSAPPTPFPAGCKPPAFYSTTDHTSWSPHDETEEPSFAASLGIATMAAVLPGTARAQDSNVLNVATDATFPPMEFVDKGQRTGFDIDIMNALAKTMGKQVQWTDIDFKGLIPGLVTHRFDAAISGIYISGIYITPERAQVVDFTQSYFAGGLSALVKTDSPIKTLADLNGKKVTVQVGTKSVNFLRDNYPQVQRVEVKKNQEMFDLVGIGRADAAVTGKPAAFQLARTRPGFRVLDKELTTEAYGIAVRKDQPQLRDQMNAALAKIKADGTYDAIVQKWFSASAGTTTRAK